MSKTLNAGDVRRLQKLLHTISSLRGSLKILNCDTPVMVELIDVMKPKRDIEACVQRALEEGKDAIRKRYDIDIK